MGTQTEEKRTTMTTSFTVVPCLQCGGEDIKLGDCGYSTFNIATGECQTCKRKLSWNWGIDTSKEEIAKKWNAENDPKVIIKALQAKLSLIQQNLKALEGLQAKRLSGKKPIGLKPEIIDKIFPPDPKKLRATKRKT